jgi:ankyrin repeat protein
MTDRVNRLLLEAASLPGHQSTVEALIRDHGANIHHSHPLNGWTALHWATKRENVGLIRFLLSNGADPLAKSLDGQSAVDIARDGDDEVVNVFSGNL